ncbi:MAG: 3'(2'),5'-bisphosphate nucleotidase CysQ [Saprospiraceae bacterium]|nr:3'(2'),5'-bisphosphate nucleotidase CysQ [Saprospiraceae bacterium]
MQILSFIDPLRAILDSASKAILEIYQDPNRFEVDRKSDNSPLTAADRASNDIICRGLEALNPSLPIVSEESIEVHYKVRSKYDYFWMVDPLDGTKEFIRRNGEFTINVALIHQTRAVLGCILVPVSGELFIGIDGKGARRYKGEEFHLMSCRNFREDAPALNLVCSRSHLNDQTKEYVSNFNEPVMLPRGSALKFTVLAAGEADIYPRLGPTMEWDTAAAQIILEEAGGSLLEWESREPLQYNKSSLLNPNFIAFGNGVLSY